MAVPSNGLLISWLFHCCTMLPVPEDAEFLIAEGEDFSWII